MSAGADNERIYLLGQEIGRVVQTVRNVDKPDGTVDITIDLKFQRNWPGYFHALALSVDKG